MWCFIWIVCWDFKCKFFCSLFLKFSDNKVVQVETRASIYKMVDMLALTTTPDLLAEMLMKCPDLRCAVKRILLRDIDDQCQKLCNRSPENSSVLRIPRSKHTVWNYFTAKGRKCLNKNFQDSFQPSFVL